MKNKKAKKRGPWGEVLHRLVKNKLAMFSLAIVVVIVLVSIFADFIAPYGYDEIDMTARFQYPSREHLLGTDNYGRDLLSRIIYGGRISLLVSVLAVALSFVGGCLLGATAGYFGGVYENIVMRLMDMLMAIPMFLLAVSISAALGTGIQNSSIAIAVGFLPASTRLMRATVLTIKDQEYVEAARATGSGQMRIIMKHIMPNTLAPIIVDTTLRIGGAILGIASLSFIGLGVQAPIPEWGSILASGREYIRDFWPLVTFPGLAIMITLIGFNLLGDGLRDALDPRLKQ